MTQMPKTRVCDGRRLRWLLRAGMVWLERNQARVDAQNVFPVPDGDTGKNMVLTMRSADEHMQAEVSSRAGAVSARVARGALMGARGNSGVILSQLLAGFAEALREQDGFDATLLLAAWRRAVAKAYQAVTEPVEGTMLTVARETEVALAQRVEQQGERDLARILETMVEAAQESLQRTPELLPVLKEAGVVDSGGQGLVYLLEGMLRLTQGRATQQSGVAGGGGAVRMQDAPEPEDAEGYGYDVQFLMHGEKLDREAIHAGIDALGWSTLVVGDERLVKVHVHVHDPGQPISWAIGQGAWLNDVVVENMQEQYEQYVAERQEESAGAADVTGEVAVIAVAGGAGLRRLFGEGLGAARVIDGGQSANPSTQDFMEAMEGLPHEAFILLPNNSNIVLAAQQAAGLTRGRKVRVVGSKSVPQGINAMLHRPTALEALDSAVARMEEALAEVVSAAVTRATRDAEFDGLQIRAGQYIGLVDGRLCVAADELEEALPALVCAALPEDGELVTLYYGDGLDEGRARALVAGLEARVEEAEIELVRGDQPLYPFLLSLE